MVFQNDLIELLADTLIKKQRKEIVNMPAFQDSIFNMFLSRAASVGLRNDKKDTAKTFAIYQAGIFLEHIKTSSEDQVIITKDNISNITNLIITKQGYTVYENPIRLKEEKILQHYRAYYSEEDLSSSSIQKMNSQLLPLFSMRAVDVPGDGNCFFHAVEDQLRLINGNIVMNYQQIRNFAVQYINGHRQEFQDFIVDENIDEYLNRISQDRQWADHNLIQALSNELRINIVIIGNNHIERPLVIGSSEFLQTIYLGHIVELHYVSLQRVSDNEEYYNNFIQLEKLVRLELEGSNQESPSEQKTEESSTNNYDLQVWKIKAIYDNSLLNHNHLLTSAYKIAGMKAVNYLLELGQDKEVAEQILLAVDDIGVEKVLEIFFSPVKTTDLQTTQTQDDKTIETIAKIEAIIGKEALNEITGYYQYVSTALSNNQLSASATKVIHIIGNFVNNLEEWLDFGIAYESIDIDNQVTIILSQLENWFDYVASGQMHIGLPPRYPGFDPDDDFGGGSGGGGQGLIYRGSADIHQNEEDITLFVGQNITALLES